MSATPRTSGYEHQRFVVVEPVTKQAARSGLDSKLLPASPGTRCPHCGNLYAQDAVFCRKCGVQRRAQGSLLAAWQAQQRQQQGDFASPGPLQQSRVALSAELSRSEGEGSLLEALPAEGEGQVTYKVYTPRRSLRSPQVYAPRGSLGAQRRNSSLAPGAAVVSPTPPVPIPLRSSFPAVRAVSTMRTAATPEPVSRSFSREPVARAAAPVLSDSRLVVAPPAPILRSASAVAVVPPSSRSPTPLRPTTPAPWVPPSPSVPMISACSTPPTAAWTPSHPPGAASALGMLQQSLAGEALGVVPLEVPPFWPPSPCKAVSSSLQPEFGLQTSQIEFKFVKEEDSPLPPFPEDSEPVNKIPGKLLHIEEQVKELLGKQESLQQELLRLKMSAKSNVESLESLRRQSHDQRQGSVARQQLVAEAPVLEPSPGSPLESQTADYRSYRSQAAGSPLQSQGPCGRSGRSQPGPTAGFRGSSSSQGAALAAARARGAAAAAEATQPRVQQSQPSGIAAGWGCSPIDWLSCGRYPPSRA